MCCWRHLKSNSGRFGEGNSLVRLSGLTDLTSVCVVLLLFIEDTLSSMGYAPIQLRKV